MMKQITSKSSTSTQSPASATNSADSKPTPATQPKPDPKVVQEAIKVGQELIKQEKTKTEASLAMYRLLHEGGCDQETIVDCLVKGANLTPMGARTYFYNCRRKYQSEQKAKSPK